MIKKHLKRALSMLLALVLVLTTFFIFDPDLLRVESDAYVDVESAEAGAFLASQTFYATETIYLQSGTSAFQYYENFDYNTGAVTSPVDTSGSVYFKNDDATEVNLYVNNTYLRSNSSTQAAAGSLKVNGVTVSVYAGMADGSATRSKGTLVTSSSSGTLNYSITSGSLAGCAEGSVYIIEWVVEYKINGAWHYSFAYTGVYASPDDQAGITLAARHQNDDATTHTYSFITGGHKVSGGNAYSAITDTSGNTKLNPLIAFAGQLNDSTNYTITGGSGYFKLGSSYFPAQANGGVAAQSFDETSCGGADTGWGTVEVSTNHYTQAAKDSLDVGTYDSPNANGGSGSAAATILRSFSDNSSRTESMCTGVAYLLVDTSRYTNYAQIPNFYVGWTQFYSYRNTRENYLDKIEITDSTGTNVDSSFSVSIDRGDPGNGGTQSFTRGLYNINGPVSAGLKFAFFSHVVCRDRSVSDHRMFVDSNVGFHTTTWSQATLRKQYNDAICTYIDYKNLVDYAPSQVSTYSTYYGTLKAVGEELADPTAHQTQANANLVTTVQNYKKAISAGAAPEVYFYVPEVIYIDPIASGGSYPLQYYVDNLQNDEGTLTYEPKKTTGNIYFNCSNAAKVTKVTYRWMDESGGSQMTLSLGSTASNSGTFTTTFTGTIASYTTSFIEWTVTYVNKAGQILTATNYSCCYALPLVYQSQNSVISATARARDTRGTFNNQYYVMTVTSWIMGVETVDYSGYVPSTGLGSVSTDNSNGVNWDYYGSYKAGFDSSTVPTAGGSSKNDHNYGGLYDQSGSTHIGGSYWYASDDDGSATYPTGGYGTIHVDSSRYTSLGQIPYLRVGLDCNFRYQHSGNSFDEGHHANLYYDWYDSSSNNVYTEAYRAITQDNDFTQGERHEGTLSEASFASKSTGTKTLVLHGANYFSRGSGRWSRATCYLGCKLVDKSSLREALYNTVSKSQYLQKEYFKEAEWNSYITKVNDVKARLLKPNDANTDYVTVSNALTNQVNKMVAAVTETDETYTYTKVDNTTATANRADVLNRGTVTVYHVLAQMNEDGSVASTSDIIATPETKTYYYGETVISGYNNYDGYNYFAYYRNEGTAKWNSSMSTSLLKGDMAAQGTYGSTGHNLDQYVKIPNLTYTYVYTEDPSGVYMDWGVSDLAFENRENLADLTNVSVDTAFSEDGTLYPGFNTETVFDGAQTYESDIAMVSKTDTDAFSFSIKAPGYNCYTPKAAGLTNLFDFSTYNWDTKARVDTSVEVVNQANKTIRMVTTGADAYVGTYSGASAQAISVVPGRTYIFSYNWENNADDSTILLPYIFYSSTTNPFSYSQLKSYSESVTGKNGTHEIEFTVPEGMKYLTIRLGVNVGAGEDITFSNISIIDTTDSTQFAKMSDLFFPEVATSLTPGKTYTIAFESSLRYDDYHWYATNMYGNSTPEMDWAHEKGTIQMFITTTSGTDNMYNYTVPVRVTTDITSGGTMGTFTMPSGCSVINLGFCITNDTGIAGWVDNIRITEGDFLEIGSSGDTYTLPEPAWEGYSFMGWTEKTNPFNGSLSGTLNATYTYGKSSDTVLANWIINKYDVTFDNEFVFDEGWNNPGAARGTLVVDEEENTLELTTLANADQADNNFLSKDYFDLIPGHRYKVSLKYMPITYASGSSLQIHVFHYATLASAQNGSGWGTFPGNSGYAVTAGGIYHSIAESGGTASIEFVVPDGYYYARIRLGNCNVKGITTQFSDIYVQDITRGVTGHYVHDTTVSEPNAEIDGFYQVVHGVVRNYKDPIVDEELTALPTISSELYDFAGWYTGKNGTGTLVTGADQTQATTNQKWSHWTVSLDYLLDSECKFKSGYSTPAAQQGIAIGGTAQIVNYVPYKIGYNFAGWQDSNTGTVYQPGDTVTLYCNAKLIPVWEAASPVNKDTEYTALNKLYPGQIYFYAYTPSANNEYVSGYVYDTTPNASVAVYSSSALLANGSTANTYGMSGVNSLVSQALTKGTTYYYGITADVTAETSVTSKFKVKEHTITYLLDSTGGTGAPSSVVGHYNTATALVEPTKTGHTFSGWKNNATQKTYNGSVVAADNSSIILANTTSFVTEQTLVAQWNILSYNLNVYAYMNQATSTTSVGTTYSVDTAETAGYVLLDDVKSTSGVVTKKVVYNSSATYEAVAKTGYTFKGWYTAPTMSGNQITAWPAAQSTSAEYTISNMGAADLNVYARFDINQYVVNVYAYSNTGAAPDTYNLSTDGGTVSLGNGSVSQTYVFGQKFTMTATPKTGYSFGGWYFNENSLTGTMSYSSATAEVTVSHSLADEETGAINYKAKFSAIMDYRLIIDANGGVAAEDVYTGYMGKEITVPNPSLAGYTFDGWILKSENNSDPFGSIAYSDGVYEYTFGAGNDRVSAQWKVDSYSVTVDPDGGEAFIRYYSSTVHKEETLTESKVLSADYNTIVELNVPSKTGYDFAGWERKDFTGTFVDGVGGNASKYTVGLNDEAVITAKWSVQQRPLNVQAWGDAEGSEGVYTVEKGGYVKIGADGQQGYTVQGNVNFGANATIYAIPETGYTFLGWQTIVPSTEDSLAIIGHSAEFETAIMGVDGLQYYAVFAINEYDVTLDAEFNSKEAPSDYVSGITGGTVAGAGTYTHGENVAVVATAKTGYVFDGWFDAEDNQVSSNSTYTFSINQAVSLTARFSVSTHTITAMVMSNTATNPDEYLQNDQAGKITGVKDSYYYGESTNIVAQAEAGYVFVAWKNDDLSQVVSNDPTLSVEVVGNAIYRAVFDVVMVDISLVAMSNADDLDTYKADAKGGTVSYDNSSYGATASGQCAYRGVDTIYAKAETGYSFDGWYSDSGLQNLVGSGTHHSEGYSSFNFTVEVSTAVTLYAKFSVDSYYLNVYAYANDGIAYDTYSLSNVGGTVSVAQGNAPLASDVTASGDGATATVRVYFGKTANITATVKTGYTFGGWYSSYNTATKKPENLVSTEPAITTTAMATAGLNYYAEFTVGSFDLIYDPNGGVMGETSVQTGTLYYNTDYLIPDSARPDPMVGFNFGGWSINPDDAGQMIYTPGAQIAAGTISEWYQTYGLSNGEVVLKAVWVASANRIFAYAAHSEGNDAYKIGTVGGTVEVVAQSADEIDADGYVAVPTGAGINQYLSYELKAGYAFKGWRYSTLDPEFAEGQSVGSSWGSPVEAATKMPEKPMYVVGFFEIRVFSANAYAYYNTAADSTRYTLGATGGTVKLGQTGQNSSNTMSEDVLFGTEVLFIATPARGYSFIGWYGAPVKTDGYVTEWGTCVETDTSLYAEVKDNIESGNEEINDYYAVFSINSYKATASVRTYTVCEDLIYSLGEDEYPAGTPSSTGGTVGLSLSPTTGEEWLDESNTEWIKTGTQATELTPSVVAFYGEKVYFAAKPNVGYIFGGWYTTPDAEYYGEDLVEETERYYSRIMREGEMYMEAKFVPVSFTLILDPNGGTSGNPTEIIVTYNSPFKIESSSFPTKTGSTFLGWADAADSTTSVEAYDITIKPEIIAQWYSTLTDVNPDYTIYAVWEEAYIKVEFDKQGATGGTSEVQITVGAKLPDLPEIPEYEGFVFGGYYSEAGGEGVQYYEADGTATPQLWNNTEGGTLYAMWSCPVLKEIDYDKESGWIYTYEDKSGGEAPLTFATAVTTAKEVTEQVEGQTDLRWWTLKVDEVDTSYVEEQAERTPAINLNHYSDSALTMLRSVVLETNTDQKIDALSQPQANSYVAKFAKNLDLDFSENKKIETNKPTVTLYENSKKIGILKSETIDAETSANGSNYAVPSASDSANYAYAGKWSYTADNGNGGKGAAVDYYLYTNSLNPVIALEIGDGAVATTVADNTSSYPTKATITDNSAGFSYVNSKAMTSAVPATDNLDTAWFTQFTTAGIGTAYDYNAKTVVYLTPEFNSSAASGTQNEIVYTISPSDNASTDDAGTPNTGVSQAEISGKNADLLARYQSYQYDGAANKDEITVCICYHNSMNGDSDEGTIDASGSYMQMYMDQVQDDVYLNQLHLLRNSGGASNWEFPTTKENVYPIYDQTYPDLDGRTLGSFAYVFDASKEATATALAEAGDYTGAKNAIIGSVAGNTAAFITALENNTDPLNIHGNSDGLGVFAISGWSCNFYPKTDSYVYVHLLDRWGNVFNRVWKCYNVDSYPSTINGVEGAAVYNVFEDGGSNIDQVTLDGANVEFVLDESSTYENGVFTTTGNTVTLSTGEANTTYNLTVTDKATNSTTVEVTTDGDGVLVLNIEDAQADFTEDAYSFILNGETVNIYSGVTKLVLDADISSVSLVGSETKVTVKTANNATKVQLVENGIFTRTFTKDMADVVENEDGTLTWNISFKTSLGTHSYAVRGRTNEGWVDSDYVLTTEIVEEEKYSPVALQYVYNDEISTGEKAEIKVRVVAGTEKVQLINADGSTLTYNRSDDIVVASVDGIETWVVKTGKYAVAGDYDVTVVAKHNGEWQKDSSKVSAIKVTEKVVDTTPVIYSVEPETTSLKLGEKTTIKVVTNSNTTKVRLNHSLTTVTYNETNSTVVDNADGTRTWTVEAKFYSLGENDINFSAKSTTDWIEGKSYGTMNVTLF